MIKITSKNNKIIIDSKKLYNKKYRKLNRECIIEGEKLLNEAILSNIKVKKIFSTDEKLLLKYKNNCSQLFLISNDILKDLSVNVSPQNIIAVIDTESHFKSNTECILILDNLQNPDNLGALIRTAVATNFNKVYAINCVDVYNEKVIRASMGTVFRCEIIETEYQQIKELSKIYSLFYADMGGENVFTISNFSNKVGFVVGNEGNGVSENIKSIISNKISLPMENNVESLNATVAGSVIMYQIYSKLNNK